MKSIFFLAAIAAPLFALAEPGDSALAEVVRRQPGPNLLARSGINPALIAQACQSQCSPVIKTLNACNSVAKCECTQANFGSLGTCLNCLQALSPPDDNGYLAASYYAGDFEGQCDSAGYVLNDVSITATPTGIASTGDPLSIFYPPFPTFGATVVSIGGEALLPTVPPGSGDSGGAVRLGALQSLNAGVVGAVAAVAIFMGTFLL
ncbi:hypothetical protein EI94DRAFT_1805272 [Lactarius quietus]|nr:hypothetical protein EI94DRAFT_1805272 [Lactarius quietus]